MSKSNLSKSTEEEIRRIVREEMSEPSKGSRRDVLKALGVLGAGAAVGGGSTAAMTGEASAATDAGDIGTPTDRYDVYAQTIDTEQATTSVSLNNSRTVAPGGDLQAAIDAVYNSTAPRASGRVELYPYDGTTYTLADIDVKPGVRLDLNGAYITFGTGSYLFRLTAGSAVDGSGAVLNMVGNSPDVWYVDGAQNPPTSTDPAGVYGWPWVRGGGGRTVYVTNGGAGISSLFINSRVYNAPQLVRLENNDGTGFINNNHFEFMGSAVETSTTSLIDLGGTANVVGGNTIHARGVVQVKDADHLVHFGNANNNRVTGTWADPWNVTNEVVDFGASGAGHNLVENNAQYHIGGSEVLWNAKLNIVRAKGSGTGLPQNLSGKSGKEPGFVATDDGTNTSASGVLCTWVDTGTDGVGDTWQPSDGSAAFV